MTLFDKVTFKHPVLRVNNRDRNIAFYKQTLGFKLVREESAIAIFSAWENKNSSFIIEESPSTRARAVEGAKKINKVIVKAAAKDIASLLANGAVAEKVFQGKVGYAFEAISPEGHVFLLHAEDSLEDLVEIEAPKLAKNEEFKGLSDFHFEKIILNVLDEEASRAFDRDVFNCQFPVALDFVEAHGQDLAVNPNETWDLEILECQVPKDYDLAALKAHFESKNLSVYLDKKETVLVISDPSKIEIWFVK